MYKEHEGHLQGECEGCERLLIVDWLLDRVQNAPIPLREKAALNDAAHLIKMMYHHQKPWSY